MEYSPGYEDHLDIMDIDMDLSQAYCKDISSLQLYVKGLNNNFNRFDLDDIQEKFFAQFLVELDNVRSFRSFVDHFRMCLNLNKQMKTVKCLHP